MDIFTIRKYRVAFTKLRVCSHRLSIETGRWHKPFKIPFENRKCYACNVLEDEYHFLFECSLYNGLRLKYIDTVYRQHPSMFKALDLITSTNETKIRNIGTFIDKAFKKRE